MSLLLTTTAYLSDDPLLHLSFANISAEKKLRIVNCCGFDCVPSDIGDANAKASKL